MADYMATPEQRAQRRARGAAIRAEVERTMEAKAMEKFKRGDKVIDLDGFTGFVREYPYSGDPECGKLVSVTFMAGSRIVGDAIRNENELTARS